MMPGVFPIRLHTRVAAAFALLALLVASTGSLATYGFSRWYLLSQRENAALTRAQLDAAAVRSHLESGGSPADALSVVPSVGTAQSLLLNGGIWYSLSQTLSPRVLPPALVAMGERSGGHQRFAINGAPFLAVAIPMPSGEYVEVFELEELDRLLVGGGWLLVISSLFAAGVGALVGATSVGRILGPVRRVEVGANRLAAGELSSRIEPTGDPDIDPIANAFNGLAVSVQSRIARERRFSANVSHELRSPLTAVLGTTELLADGVGRLPEREARLVEVLASQVRRMSQTLLDLLEISKVVADEPLQSDSMELCALCRGVLENRGLDPAFVQGESTWMRTDARRIERIIGNLVDNALIHGGGLTSLVVNQAGGVVTITIDDDGPGIPEDQSERVFEPFVRGSHGGKSEGAGLGMAIAREQAQALGGNIVSALRHGGGARLVITLPHPDAA